MGRIKKFLLPALLGLAVYYAVFGGEYSLLELRRARTEIQAKELELAALTRTLDSLRAWVDSLQNDSATLERLAREKFGLIRDGEILYRMAVPTDSVPDTLP
ncbi:MAG: septum formation initiator family protein [Gemmatimonadota bacterium]|jgi:cell division protein FtsB